MIVISSDFWCVTEKYYDVILTSSSKAQVDQMVQEYSLMHLKSLKTTRNKAFDVCVLTLSFMISTSYFIKKALTSMMQLNDIEWCRTPLCKVTQKKMLSAHAVSNKVDA